MASKERLATKKDLGILSEDLRISREATKADLRILSEDLRISREAAKEDLRTFREAMRQDLREALSESQQGLKTHFDERFNKLAIAVDKCVPRAEFQEAIGKLDAKVDRLVVVMDRMTGELFDNSQSHVLFGAMFGDHCRSLSSHARRITALEGRLTPPAP